MANEIFLHARKRGQSIVENALLDDYKMSGLAKYLLIQFCSHRAGDWKIQMKDIIQRSTNGRDAHYKALTELIHNKYVARIRVTLKGIHKEVIYVYGQVKEDVAEVLEETVKLKLAQEGDYAVRVEFGKPDTENPNVVSEGSEASEKPLPEKPNVDFPNTENQYITKNQEQITNNNKDNINNDDDKRASSSRKESDESINIIIDIMREETKDDLSLRSFKSVVKKVVDKHRQGRVQNFRDYLCTALVNKIEDLELRRIKENAKTAIRNPKVKDADELIKAVEDKVQSPTKPVPFYNWLES